MRRALAPVLLCILALLALPVRSAAQELGDISFPNSGHATAQAPFLRGVKALHSFQFDEAAVDFRDAQKADLGFALAYWGEAMTYNHALWGEQDIQKAKAALDRGAAARPGTEKERAYMDAQQILFFAPMDKLGRDKAYTEALARMHARWPDDDEVSIFYALALLGEVRRGEPGFRRQARAAALALDVFQRNPKHPGAAHFIIHAFDDPEHAPLALPAARAYAQIAPAAAHALHMPSHIFVQLGMWEDVRASNTVAYKAAVEVARRLKLAEGRDDFHALGWLMYANLMLGRFDEARADLELAKATMDRNPGDSGIRDSYLAMRARYISETGRCETLTLAGAPEHAGHGPMPGMLGMGGYYTPSAWNYVVGVCAAKAGDFAGAEAALAGIKAANAAAAGFSTPAAKADQVREKELAAVILSARGDRAGAVQQALAAADLEDSMPTPNGPPDLVKPAAELSGELLLEAGRPAEAAQAFSRALLRTPNRTPSVAGLAKAQASAHR